MIDQLLNLVMGAEWDDRVGSLHDEIAYSKEYKEVREFASKQGISIHPCHSIKLEPSMGRCVIKDYSELFTIMSLTESDVDYSQMDEDVLLDMIWNEYWDVVTDWYEESC